MKAILIQGKKRTEIELSEVKRISAISQCNISVLKHTGETITGSLIELV